MQLCGKIGEPPVLLTYICLFFPLRPAFLGISSEASGPWGLETIQLNKKQQYTVSPVHNNQHTILILNVAIM